MNSKAFPVSTADGCRRLFAMLLVIILAASFMAAGFSSDWGRIKIQNIQIDARGAEINGDLYYPAGTTDEDKLPAVVIAPGAGVVKENMRGIAEELAKRGYVVFNVNPYGNGLSETPVYNENDMGPDQFNIFATPLGVLDAVDFVRNLEFVDSTRIGLSGHSQGSRRTGYAALMDCGYYTFNDVKLILLSEKFGVEISEDDISRDADAIAAERLSDDTLAVYEKLAVEYRADYDTMSKALCLLGSTAQFCNPTATVEICGHEVTRTCKVNMAIINGKYDWGYLGFNNADDTKAAWYIPVEDNIVNEGYYALDDYTGTSELIGSFRNDTIGSNEALKAAIENRSLRIVMQTPETHSKNFFSKHTAAMVVDFFAQTLDNNSSKAMTADSEIGFMTREIFNAIAMLAMVAMIIPVIGMFMLRKSYSTISEGSAYESAKVSPKWANIIVPIVTVAWGFFAIYRTNANKTLFSNPKGLGFPLMITAWSSIQLLEWLALGALIIAVVYALATGKIKDAGSFVLGNFKIGIKNILRCIVIACGFIAVAYLVLETIEYFFQQDYRYWMAAYTMLKANHWMYVFNYAVLALPFFFVLSLVINYLSNETMKNAKPIVDTVMTVIVNTAGIWVCCALSAWLAYSGTKTDGLFSSFILTYGAIITVPINVFVIRKSYKMTKSVWVGVIVCSLLTAWLLVSTSGMNASWIPQTWASVFLGR